MNQLQQQVLTNEQRAQLKAAAYQHDATAAELVRLRTQHRWDQRNLTLYRRLVEGRQAERDQAARREADLESRIDTLRATVADMLAAFTDDDPHPRCGSPRARSRWVPSRTLRQWRDQIVEEG